MNRCTGLAALYVALAVTVGACKGDSATTLSTPTTAVPATTTTTTKEHGYRVQYLNTVSGINCLTARLGDVYDGIDRGRGFTTEADWPRIQAELLPVLKQFGDGLVSFYQDLARLEWPESATEDIRLLMRESTSDAGAALAQAAATSYEEFINLPGQTGDGGKAAAVRAILGLPTNLGEDGHDWCQGPPNIDPTPSPAAVTTTTPASSQ